MIRHFDFIDGTPTLVPPDRCVLVVETTRHRFDADCTDGVSYSACYKDNPGLSYEFGSTGQFRRWLAEQGRIRLPADAD